jgi:hypothetical protein
MLLIHGIEKSALFSVVIAIAAYALTYFSIGERADKNPAGAIIPAFLLTPWWAALCAGITAHVIAVSMSMKTR